MRAISSGEEAAPPSMMLRMLDRSYWPRSGAFSSALAMVGTRLMSVARCSWISLNTKVGSKRRTITCLTPKHGGSLRTAPAIGVEQRDGVQVHQRFDSLNMPATESACRYRVRWDSITPFGVPVLPLV